MKTSWQSICLSTLILSLIAFNASAEMIDLTAHLENYQHNLVAEVTEEKKYTKADLGKEIVKHLHVGAAYIFWVPYQDGMQVAYYMGDTGTVGSIITPSFNPKSGFKVFGGKGFGNGSVSVFVNYLWFYNDPGLSEATLIEDPDEGMPIYNTPFEDGTLTSLDLNSISRGFSNYFQRIDAILQKEYKTSEYLIICPSAGLLGAWDTAFLKFDADVDSSENTLVTRYKQNWWGIGPYATTSCTYLFFKELGLYGKVGASLLLANYKTTELLRLRDGNGDFTRTDINNYTSTTALEPVVELSFGLVVRPKSKEDTLELFIGWEGQTYFSHNKFQKFPASGETSNYSMQGLTAGLLINL